MDAAASAAAARFAALVGKCGFMYRWRLKYVTSSPSLTFKRLLRAESQLILRLFSASWRACALMYWVRYLVTSVRAISVPLGFPRNWQRESEISAGLANPLGGRLSSPVRTRRLRFFLLDSRTSRATFFWSLRTSAVREVARVRNSWMRVRISLNCWSRGTSSTVSVDSVSSTGGATTTGATTTGSGAGAAATVFLEEVLLALFGVLGVVDFFEEGIYIIS
mgnify:FL=1